MADRITRILALAEAASTAPWQATNTDAPDEGGWLLVSLGYDPDDTRQWYVCTGRCHVSDLHTDARADAAFIAAARTETPWLASTLQEALRLLNVYGCDGDGEHYHEVNAFLARVRSEGEL